MTVDSLAPLLRRGKPRHPAPANTVVVHLTPAGAAPSLLQDAMGAYDVYILDPRGEASGTVQLTVLDAPVEASWRARLADPQAAARAFAGRLDPREHLQARISTWADDVARRADFQDARTIDDALEEVRAEIERRARELGLALRVPVLQAVNRLEAQSFTFGVDVIPGDAPDHRISLRLTASLDPVAEVRAIRRTDTAARLRGHLERELGRRLATETAGNIYLDRVAERLAREAAGPLLADTGWELRYLQVTQPACPLPATVTFTLDHLHTHPLVSAPVRLTCEASLDRRDVGMFIRTAGSVDKLQPAVQRLFADAATRVLHASSAERVYAGLDDERRRIEEELHRRVSGYGVDGRFRVHLVGLTGEECGEEWTFELEVTPTDLARTTVPCSIRARVDVDPAQRPRAMASRASLPVLRERAHAQIAAILRATRTHELALQRPLARAKLEAALRQLFSPHGFLCSVTDLHPTIDVPPTEGHLRTEAWEFVIPLTQLRVELSTDVEWKLDDLGAWLAVDREPPPVWLSTEVDRISRAKMQGVEFEALLRGLDQQRRAIEGELQERAAGAGLTVRAATTAGPLPADRWRRVMPITVKADDFRLREPLSRASLEAHLEVRITDVVKIKEHLRRDEPVDTLIRERVEEKMRQVLRGCSLSRLYFGADSGVDPAPGPTLEQELRDTIAERLTVEFGAIIERFHLSPGSTPYTDGLDKLLGTHSRTLDVPLADGGAPLKCAYELVVGEPLAAEREAFLRSPVTLDRIVATIEGRMGQLLAAEGRASLACTNPLAVERALAPIVRDLCAKTFGLSVELLAWRITADLTVGALTEAEIRGMIAQRERERLQLMAQGASRETLAPIERTIKELKRMTTNVKSGFQGPLLLSDRERGR